MFNEVGKMKFPFSSFFKVVSGMKIEKGTKHLKRVDSSWDDRKYTL